MLNAKCAEGEDPVDPEDAGKIHVRQDRGNGKYREHLSTLARARGLTEVASALRSETGDATVAYHTLRAANLDPAAYSTFMRHDREGFRSRQLDKDAVVAPPRDPKVGAKSQKKVSLNEPLFDGFVSSMHTVNGAHKEVGEPAACKMARGRCRLPARRGCYRGVCVDVPC